MNRILSRLTVIASRIALLKIATLTINRLKPLLVLAVVFPAALPFSGAHRSASVDSARAASCAGPEYHSFDFWMGDWSHNPRSLPASKLLFAAKKNVISIRKYVSLSNRSTGMLARTAAGGVERNLCHTPHVDPDRR